MDHSELNAITAENMKRLSKITDAYFSGSSAPSLKLKVSKKNLSTVREFLMEIKKKYRGKNVEIKEYRSWFSKIFMVTAPDTILQELFCSIITPSIDQITIINEPYIYKDVLKKLTLVMPPDSFSCTIEKAYISLKPLSGNTNFYFPRNIWFGYSLNNATSDEDKRRALDSLGRNFVNALAEVDSKFEYPANKETLEEKLDRLASEYVAALAENNLPISDFVFPSTLRDIALADARTKLPRYPGELNEQCKDYIGDPIAIPLPGDGATGDRVVTYPSDEEVLTHEKLRSIIS